MARDLTKLSINMPVEMVARIDTYAEKMGVSRTSAINVLCGMALDNQRIALEKTGMVKKKSGIKQVEVRTVSRRVKS